MSGYESSTSALKRGDESLDIADYGADIAFVT